MLIQFKDTNSVCKRCIEIEIQAGTPLKCNKCQAWKCEAAVYPHQRTHLSTTTRICTDCEDTRVCVVCKVNKTQNTFTERQWRLTTENDKHVQCKECMDKEKVYGHVEEATFLRQRIISVIGLPI